MEDNWKFFKEIDFSDESVLQYNVDTRDFHVSCMRNEDTVKLIDTHKLEKYPERFFHTSEEVLDLLDGYFIGSGGRVKWRFFSLEGVDNWSMKYIRIQRTPHGLVVCNGDLRALNRELLANRVNNEFN
jgi:hypothetical protein